MWAANRHFCPTEHGPTNGTNGGAAFAAGMILFYNKHHESGLYGHEGAHGRK